MKTSQEQLAYWKNAVFTLLLLAPRAVWIACVIVGALTLAGMAYAGGSCPRVLSSTPEGTTVVISAGCQLEAVARMFPQIDPATNAPYPVQVQLRSIYAANQNYVEADGTLRRRTVLRTCAKPGKPDPYADTEEKTVCPKGLMYYFGVASDGGQAKIFIPGKRVLTQAESAEKAEQEMAAADAAKAKEREARQTAADARERIQVDAQSAAKIAQLDNDLAESRQTIAALKGPASKGRWFWGMVICMLGLAAWGVGGTMSTIRARQVKPVIATGRFFASDEVASSVLSEENLNVRLENEKLRDQVKSARQAHADELKVYIAKVESLEGSVSERTLLSEVRFREREEARKERDANGFKLEQAQNAAIALRQDNERQRAEIARLNSDNQGLRALKEMLEAEKSQLHAKVQQLGESESERQRLVAEARELEDTISTFESAHKGHAKHLMEMNADLLLERAHVEQLEAEKRELALERDQAVTSHWSIQSRLDNMQNRAANVQELETALPDQSEEPTRIRKDTIPFGVSHLALSSVNISGKEASSGIKTCAGLGSASSAIRRRTIDRFPAVQPNESPEDRFVRIMEEMDGLRNDRNIYERGISEIRTIVFGDPVPAALTQLEPADMVRLLVDDVTDVYRQSGRLFVRGAAPVLR